MIAVVVEFGANIIIKWKITRNWWWWPINILTKIQTGSTPMHTKKIKISHNNYANNSILTELNTLQLPAYATHLICSNKNVQLDLIAVRFTTTAYCAHAQGHLSTSQLYMHSQVTSTHTSLFFTHATTRLRLFFCTLNSTDSTTVHSSLTKHAFFVVDTAGTKGRMLRINHTEVLNI